MPYEIMLVSIFTILSLSNQLIRIRYFGSYYLSYIFTVFIRRSKNKNKRESNMLAKCFVICGIILIALDDQRRYTSEAKRVRVINSNRERKKYEVYNLEEFQAKKPTIFPQSETVNGTIGTTLPSFMKLLNQVSRINTTIIKQNTKIRNQNITIFRNKPIIERQEKEIQEQDVKVKNAKKRLKYLQALLINGTQPVGNGTQPVGNDTQPVGNDTQPVGNGTQPVGNSTNT